jgi:hypothetical protein
MWILDTNDYGQGRRMWLKPGQRYLIGRVKKDGVVVAIDEKSVSRQHFSIAVDAVEEDDVGKALLRTRIRVEDYSKIGTTVNGEVIRKKNPKDESEPYPSKELSKPENTIRPGRAEKPLIVKWEPCVFTFNLLKKEIKTGVLKQKQAAVRSFDIKAISEFSHEHTTHVVASKRNTPKGLQALINGKYLITDAFIDDLQYATSQVTESQDITLSRLEENFDISWPDANKFLPPPGKEPTIKPAEAYRPDPARAQIFEHYTFVFCDQTQYDNLLPVVSDGHGKALYFRVISAETKSDQLLEFAVNASGQKAGRAQDSNAAGGVILVRPSLKDEVLQEWTTKIMNEVSLKMDQRSIDQSEFLDAILSNDARLLKQPVPFETTNDSIIAPPNSAVNSLVSQPAAENSAATSQLSEGDAVGRPNTRSPSTSRPAAQVVSSAQRASDEVDSTPNSTPAASSAPKVTQTTKFENFDDGFDPDAVDVYDDEDDVGIDEDDLVAHSPAELNTPTQEQNIKKESPTVLKKRQRSPDEDAADGYSDGMDEILPAAAEMRKRKLAETQANGVPKGAPSKVSKPPAKKARTERLIDVREAVIKRQQEQEAAMKGEEDRVLPDLEDTAPANLVEVIATNLPVRDKKTRTRMNGEHGPDWDPKWNGRKNFKLFRHKGDGRQHNSRLGKVIVPLEEVPNKTGGLGDKYYSRTEEELALGKEKKRREQARSQRTTQSSTQPMSSSTGDRRSKPKVVYDLEDDSPPDSDDEHDDKGPSRQTSPALSLLQRETAAIAEHDIDLETPRQTRAADRLGRTSVDRSDTEQDDSSQLITQTQKGKRPATASAEDVSKPKRQKTLPVTRSRNGDSDDDETKFRFGSRRRGRG